MPKNSLQEKQRTQNHTQHSSKTMTTTLKRKRRATERSEDSENIYPPTKVHLSGGDSQRVPPQHSSPLKEQQEPATWSELRSSTCFLTPSSSRLGGKPSPLPSLPWADGGQVWHIMCLADQRTLTQRDPKMFQRHPTLQPRMRAILLDWLIEVCEVYKLHRETYYLAMDYIDRYLSTHQNVPKNQLQLIGITCLFIAAKMEEIYPPKIAEFAYVTDGACTEEEILDKELIILKGLGWNLGSKSPPGWLNIYMQVESADTSRPKTFIYPQYSGLQYSQAAQLLDLASLDEGSLRFPYSHLAAAALCHIQSRECALRVSRVPWEQLAPCVKWLNPFATIVNEEESQALLRSAVPPLDTNSGSGLRATVPNIVLDESHRIQTHVVDLTMLEKVQQLQAAEIVEQPIDSPIIEGAILTPPSSSQKNSPDNSPSLST